MMNDELAAISGKYEEVVGRLQEKYGIAKEEAKQQVDLFRKTVQQLRRSNRRLIAMQKELDKRTKAGRKPVKAKLPAKKKTRTGTNKQFTTTRSAAALR